MLWSLDSDDVTETLSGLFEACLRRSRANTHDCLARIPAELAVLNPSRRGLHDYGRNLDGQGNIPVLEKSVYYTQVDEVHPSGSSLSMLIISMASSSRPG